MLDKLFFPSRICSANYQRSQKSLTIYAAWLEAVYADLLADHSIPVRSELSRLGGWAPIKSNGIPSILVKLDRLHHARSQETISNIIIHVGSSEPHPPVLPI